MIVILKERKCYSGSEFLFLSKCTVYLVCYPSSILNAFLAKRDPAIATEEALKKWLELSKKYDQVNGSMDAFIESNYIDALPSPRFIKSHLPLSCLPPNLLDVCKVIYVARNPRGTVIILELMRSQ